MKNNLITNILSIIIIFQFNLGCNGVEETSITPDQRIYCGLYIEIFSSIDDIKKEKSEQEFFGTKFEMIGELFIKTFFDFFTGKSKSYYKIRLDENKKEGYVRSDTDFLKYSLQSDKCKPQIKYVSSGTGLILRSKPSRSGAKITTVPNDSKLEISQLLRSENGDYPWGKTSYEGVDGYVYTEFLQDSPISIIERKEYTYCDVCEDGPFLTLTIDSLLSEEEPTLEIFCSVPSKEGKHESGQFVGKVKKVTNQKSIKIQTVGDYIKTKYNKGERIEEILPNIEVILDIEDETFGEKPPIGIFIETKNKNTCLNLHAYGYDSLINVRPL